MRKAFLVATILMAFLPAAADAGARASSSGPTIVASGVRATAIAIDAAGDVYAADPEIIGITPGGTVQSENPSNTKRIRKFSPNGVVSPFASGLPNIGGMAVDSAGNVYVAEYDSTAIKKYAPDGSVSDFASGFTKPGNIAFDASGNLYVCDRIAGSENSATGYWGEALKRVAPSGEITVVSSGLSNVTGIAVDRSGNVFVSEEGTMDASYSYGPGKILKVAPGGAVVQVGKPMMHLQGIAVDRRGNVYVSSGQEPYSVKRITPQEVLTTVASKLNPMKLAFGPDGELYIIDAGHSRIIKIKV
jgi:sugar lactone lactonase YvrE